MKTFPLLESVGVLFKHPTTAHSTILKLSFCHSSALFVNPSVVRKAVKPSLIGYPNTKKPPSRLNKELITQAPVLCYFDVNKDVTTEFHRCDIGLSAVLTQDGCPVAYTSRALTQIQLSETALR